MARLRQTKEYKKERLKIAKSLITEKFGAGSLSVLKAKHVVKEKKLDLQRQIYAYLIQEGFNLSEIGKLSGKAHGTIRHGVNHEAGDDHGTHNPRTIRYVASIKHETEGVISSNYTNYTKQAPKTQISSSPLMRGGVHRTEGSERETITNTQPSASNPSVFVASLLSHLPSSEGRKNLFFFNFRSIAVLVPLLLLFLSTLTYLSYESKVESQKSKVAMESSNSGQTLDLLSTQQSQLSQLSEPTGTQYAEETSSLTSLKKKKAKTLTTKYVSLCGGDNKLQWNGARFVCSPDVPSVDTDTNYYPTGISIGGSTNKTITVGRNGLDNISTSFTDLNTTYQAGSGLDLSGTTFSIPTSGVTNQMLEGNIKVSKLSSSNTPTAGQLPSYDNVTGGINWITASGTGTVTQIDSGNGLSGGPITTTGSLAINAPTCTGTEKLSWNGTAFNCSADIDTDIDTNTTYTAGTGLSLIGTVFSVADSYDDNFLTTTSSFGGDVSGTYNNIAVANDSHNHTASTLPVHDSLTGAGTIDTTLEVQGVSVGGDTSGSVGSIVVTDDSHAHTGSTISGLDISSDTNLSGDTEIVLTGDTLSIAGAMTRDTEWNTVAKIETATSVNILTSGENNSLLANDSGYITGSSSSALTNKTGNISQWTNDSSFITDGNTNWDNSYGYITDGNTGWDNSYGFITAVDFSQINNGSGIYLNYKPNNTACGNEQVLKYDSVNNRWICGNDSGGTGDNNYPTSIAFSGTTTKTLTLQRQGLSDLTADFTDIDTDTNTTYTAGAGLDLTDNTFSILGTYDDNFLLTSGGTMTGNITLGANTLTTSNTTLISNLNSDQLDGQHGNYYMSTSTDHWVDESGDTMTGSLNFSGIASDITTATDENLIITPGGTGKVGIATTNPEKTLDITGTGRITSTGGATLDVASPTNTILNITGGGANTASLNFQSGAGSINYSTNQHEMRFNTSSYQQMVITNTGKVGIGDTNPNQRLTISDLRGVPATTGTTQNGMLRLTPTIADGGAAALDMGVYTLNGAGWLQAGNRESLDVNYPILINPNGGNVGIGTTDPTAKLEIRGGIKAGTNGTEFTVSTAGVVTGGTYNGAILSGGSLSSTAVNGVTTANILTTGTSFSGDVSGTYGAIVVTDDSHNHTGSTISGLDISLDTNLSGDTEIVLTGNALSIAGAMTRDTEWNTVAKIETATSANIVTSGENNSLLANDSGYITGSSSNALTNKTGNISMWTNDANFITLTALSSSATGLTYTNTTGAFSLTTGYVIPTTTQESNWGTAYSNRVDTWNYPLSISGSAVSLGYNSTNLKLTSNALNTIQDIATSSSPSFVTLTSTQVTGTAPFTVASTTLVSNLNSDYLEGQHGSYYLNTGTTFGGDLSGAYNALTVVKINGVSLAGLTTGILKNTTTTGVPSIAVAGDFPTLNQNTTGSSASFTGNLVGEVTGPQGTTVIDNASVIAKVLTGYVSGSGTISATDTLLGAIQKLNGNVALKAPLASPTFTGTVAGITPTMVSLGNVTNESKATMFTSPTFTGTVAGVTATMVGLGNVPNLSFSGSNTGDNATNTLYSSLVTNATHTGDATGSTALTVAKINGATLGTTTATAGNLLIGSGTQWVSNAVSGDITINSSGATSIGSLKVTNGMLAGSIASSKLVGTDIQTVGTITAGTWNGGSIGDAYIDNNITASNYLLLSGGTMSGNIALGANTITTSNTTVVTNLNADKVDGYDLNQGLQTTNSPSFVTLTSTQATGTAPFTVASTTLVSNLNSDYLDGQHGSYYAPIASPTFTGTVSGITSTMVGLGNVTNESKATMFSSPTFTGTVSGVTSTMVGLGNVPNLSFSGSNTGDNAVNTLYSGLVTNATHTGDATGSTALTVAKINGATLGTTTATAGNLLIGSGTQWVSNAVSGDITINSSGVTAIGATKVTNGMLAGSIASSKLVGTDIATVGTITVGTWNGGSIGDAYIDNNITASNYLLLSGGTMSGNITLGGNTLTTSNTTVVTNLNADQLDGMHASSFDQSNTNEIQTLGTSGNTITLTSGGSVTAPYATSAGNADTLDGLHSNSFLTSDTVVRLSAIRNYTSTQTWNKPANLSYIVVEVWGGGGGGGYDSDGCNSGGNGGTSSFGSFLSATGGSGVTGAGGNGSSGDINLAGNSVSGPYTGGSSPRGGAGGPWMSSGNMPGGGGGGNACMPGGGGGYSQKMILASSLSSSYTATVGGGGWSGNGAGGSGSVIVYEYTTVTTGTDLAENYPVTDPTISAGDIVSFDGTHPIGIKRAETGDTAPMAGIIATSPGLLLSDQKDATGQRPVALSGRVPTKVNLENGEIKVGDRIALSGVPGTGRKANQFEASVGVALEPYNNDSTGGTIIVFIDLNPGLDVKELKKQITTTDADQRNKENIAYFKNNPVTSLSKIMQLQPARYDYITGEKNQLGFIAQDVQQVIPEAVSITDPKTGMLGLKTDFIIPYLVGAAQEQQITVESLATRLTSLEEKVSALGESALGGESATLRVESIDTRLASVETTSEGYSTELAQLEERLAQLDEDLRFKIYDLSGDNTTNTETTTGLPGSSDTTETGVTGSSVGAKDDTPEPSGTGQAGTIDSSGTSNNSDLTQQIQTEIQTQLLALDLSAKLQGDVINNLNLKNLTVISDATFAGDVKIEGSLTLGVNNVGKVEVLPGEMKVRVEFKDAYPRAPIVTASQLDFLEGQYRITDISETGFAIELSEMQQKSVFFNWYAVGTNEVSSSSGTSDSGTSDIK